MCDSLCVLTPEGTVFAKNSDRPPGEIQLPEVQRQRPAGGRLRTQYLDIADEGACAVLLSRPDWLWGAEHGLNEHGVAIGNEKVDTRSGTDNAPPALIGMDLVRLGLERARGADQAVEMMTTLLERHGQGGIADTANKVAYDSSFLVADGSSAWVLETAGRTWAAEPAGAAGVAISNRLTIRGDWTHASADVPAGADFDGWRDPDVDAAHADVRLAASRTFLRSRQSGAAAAEGSLTPRNVVGHLRDHGTGSWGEPATTSSPRRAAAVVPPPSVVRADGTGVTICMHARSYMATTASMVAYLPRPGSGALRSWVAAGSPCVSVYVPFFGMPDLTPAMVDARLWQAGAELRRRVEEDGEELFSVRDVLDPLEAELWAEADELIDQPARWNRFHVDAWRRVQVATEWLTGRA